MKLELCSHVLRADQRRTRFESTCCVKRSPSGSQMTRDTRGGAELHIHSAVPGGGNQTFPNFFPNRTASNVS